MRHIFRLSALLLIAMLAIVGSGGATSAAAQSDPFSGMGDDLSEYEGIQEAVGRFYLFDYEGMMSASPEAMENMELPTGVQGGLFAVLQFDNEDNASAALDKVREEADSSMSEEVEGTTTEAIENENLSDNAVAYKSVTSDETLGATTTVIIAEQDAEYVYLSSIFAFGEGEDPTDLAVSSLGDMQETDAGDGEATFNEDGTSEGGLWDKLPDADAADGVFEGLVATDEQLYPTEGGTPASD